MPVIELDPRLATGDALCTAQLQAAIDAVAAAGGGRVVVPPGRWRIGTIHLRSRLTLELQAGAVLIASHAKADYPAQEIRANPLANVDLQPHHLLIAHDVEDVLVCGGGTIDGQGPAFWDPPSTCEFFTRRDWRPSPLIELDRSRRIRIDGIHVRDAPGWTVHVNACEGVRLHAVDLRNSLIGPNTDGFDINDSCDVQISDCTLVCGDDAIVLKSLGGVNQRIQVVNCVLQTRCSALKLGANESLGTIRQVTFSNCIIRDSSRGLHLACMSGGRFEDVTMSNIVCETDNDLALVNPIHIDCSRNPGFPERGIGRIRNVRIAGVLARSDARILVTAEDPGAVENVFLSDIHMDYPRQVESEFAWARRARSLQFSPGTPEARAAQACLVAENVRGLAMRDLVTTWPVGGTDVPMHAGWLRNVERAHIDCPQAVASRPEVERWRIEGGSVTIR